MTGVDADLATLREELTRFLVERRGKYPQRDSLDALARVEAELSRLREQRDEHAYYRKVQQTFGEEQFARAEAAEARCAELREKLEWAVRALVRLREMLYNATITYSSFCGRCGPMDDADPADPKYLGSPMMTETLPLREVVEKALAGLGSGQSSLTESGSAGLPDTPADSHYRERPIEEDFYLDPRGEWVYRWSDERRVLKPADSQEDKT